MGDLVYSKLTDDSLTYVGFQADIPDRKKASNVILCSRYSTGSTLNEKTRLNMNDMEILRYTPTATQAQSTKIAIRDDSLASSDPSEIGAILAGTMLYYEVENPEEIDITNIMWPYRILSTGYTGTINISNRCIKFSDSKNIGVCFSGTEFIKISEAI